MKSELEVELRKKAIEAAITYYRHTHGQKKPLSLPVTASPMAGGCSMKKRSPTLSTLPLTSG